MKKILSFVLTCVMVFSLAACGSQPVANSDNSVEPSVPSDSVHSTETPVEGVSEGDASEELEDGDSSLEAPNTPAASVDVPVIEETVLVDEAGIKIVAKRLSMTSLMGPSVELSIENNTGKTLGFQAKNSSVNSYTVDSFLASSEISSGDPASNFLYFVRTDLDEAGITDIGTMRVMFHIYDPESYDTYLDIGPIELKTSLADKVDKPATSLDGEVLYEKDGIKFVLDRIVEDGSDLGKTISVYAKNTGDTPVLIKLQDVLLNGYTADTPFSLAVMPGEAAVGDISFDLSTIVNNNITSIDSLRISLQVMERDTLRILDESDPIWVLGEQ